MSIHIKTEKEIEAMRKSGKILAAILTDLAAYVKPGLSTWDLEKRAEKLCEEYNVQPGFKGYHGYPCILCTAVNNEVVHSIPTKTPLQEGDVLSIDAGVIVDGMNTDSAIALVVGKESHPEREHFVNTCIRALWKGIEQVKPGNKIGDIGYAIEQTVRAAGYRVVPELTGHGIGYKLHEEPYVYNYGKRGNGPALKPGMTIAIEPIIVTGHPAIETLEDGWTIATKDGGLGIQHEHTILVTETGHEVLTLREGEKEM